VIEAKIQSLQTTGKSEIQWVLGGDERERGATGVESCIGGGEGGNASEAPTKEKM